MSLAVVESITELVGATPLLHLRKIVPVESADVFVKLEYLNPGGSIKDRTAIGMIEAAERSGCLRPGATIVEPTAGNTGIGLALIGIARGYRVIVCVPEKFSAEKVNVMAALGAQVVRTPNDLGMEGAIRRAREIAAQIPNSYVPQQFENPANPEFHYRTTGPEIYEQMAGRIDAVIIGVGTGGTFTGVARYLKERVPGMRAIAVETQGSILKGGVPGPHRVEGIGVSFVPKTFDGSLADDIVMVTDDQAFTTVIRLARSEAVLAGGSGGANVFAAINEARRLGAGKRVVTIVPDGAERYVSKGIFTGEPD
jgi:cysteine synthase A